MLSVKHTFVILAVVFCWVPTTSASRADRHSNKRSLLANYVAAGTVCKLNDPCSPVAFSSNGPQLCPFNVTANMGICPLAQAGQQCFPGDICSTSATTGSLCPATDSGGGSCPYLSAGATCTSAADTTTPGRNNSIWGQLCNAKVASEASYDNKRSTEVGVCVTPKTAGSSCTVGTDLCSGSATFAAMFCTNSGTCPVARPGATCSAGDLCSTGDNVSGSTTSCPTTNRYTNTCPAVATNGACQAGDQCTGVQVCNTATGMCVTPDHAGAACTGGLDWCHAPTVPGTLSVLGGAIPGQVCSASTNTCPFASAGSACYYGDMCSSGTVSGTACNAFQNGGASFCPQLPPNAACYQGDRCERMQSSPQQYCDAFTTGMNATEGQCINGTAAGEFCVAFEDVCSPSGSMCGASEICPKADAGLYCNTGDLCSSGSAGGTICPVDASSGASAAQCPYLPTGAACTATDLCVFGATCVGARGDGSASGICTSVYTVASVIIASPAGAPAPVGSNQGNNMNDPAAADEPALFATNTTENATATVQTYSNATTVPAVISVASLSAYATVAAFNATERERFVDTLEANIYAKINALVNVTITNVVAGSIQVTNSVAFTSGNAAAALAGQSALAAVLTSGDVSDIFGTSFGSVTVTGVALGTATNPTVQSGAVSAGLAAWTLGSAMLLAFLGLSL